MDPVATDYSWLCAVVLFGFMTLVIIFSVRSRFRYARRIREAQARGAFNDLNLPEAIARRRIRTILSLIGLLGFLISIITLFVLQYIGLKGYFGIIIAAIILFIIITLVTGMLRQREIDKRL